MTVNDSDSTDFVTALRIRPATDADRPRLIPVINTAFAVETFLEGTRTDDQRLAAMMQSGTILVAEDASGELLGCIYTEVHQRQGYMGQLAVDPAHQRKGLARRLMAEAEEYLRSQGCPTVKITVLSTRPELPPLYRRFGFIETGTEEARLSRQVKPGVICHFIVMMKEL
ncbi:MAG: GNAT family N-acetyltransferase [Terracidiphilus sp.]